MAAKRVAADEVDFDKAEREAKEEQERIQKLGYNPAEETTTTTTNKLDNKKNNDNDMPASLTTPSSLANPAASSTTTTESTKPAPVRLGFGQTSVPQQAKETSKPTTPRPPVDNGPPSEVVNKYGNQKGISSDEFFGRDSYDPQAQAEAKSRLQAFNGATSISSNNYFGRDEDEQAERGNSGEFGSMERVAQDLADKLKGIATEDVGALRDAFEQGASKFGSYVRDYLR